MTWRTIANQLLSTLFEPPCAACKQRLRLPLNGAVCEACWSSLRLAPRIDEHGIDDYAIARTCAVDRYDGRMKEIIHALKYERRRSISPRLGALMRERGAALLADASIVVPVPLHPRREYERGFNQAEDLALHLGPPVMRLLKRIKHTPSQIALPREQRHRNVEEAFALNDAARSLVPDPRSPLSDFRSPRADPRSPLWELPSPQPLIVVLVDDVSTTGATLEACANVLKSAGVTEVRAITAARVVTARR